LQHIMFQFWLHGCY